MSTNDTFLILDVSGWIAPALLGTPGGATNANGVPIEGPSQLFSRIFELLEKQRPGYFVVACDSPRESLVRKEWFPAYKAKRPPKTEVFAMQSKLIYKAFGELGFPMCRIDGWEADDVVATYAHNYAGVMELTTIASNDKDMHQLLDLDKVRILKPQESFLFRKDVEAIWGVPVHQIRHVQALTGDFIDGIPGAAGVGPKKAAPLILKYGTAKRAKESADEQTPGLKIALKSFDAGLNLKLVTLQRSLPIPEELPSWALPKPSDIRRILRPHGISAAI